MRLAVFSPIGLMVAIPLALLLCLSWVPNADAQPRQEQLPEHRIALQMTGYYLDYREVLPSPLKSNESGGLIGGRLDYLLVPETMGIVLGLTGELTVMDTAYDGSLQDGTPLQDESDNVFVQVEGTVGWNLAEGVFDGTRIELYSGLGYRYWHRDLGGENSYSEDYQWFHIPIGARSEVLMGKGLSLGADIAALIMFAGTIQFNLSEADDTLNNPTADLGAKPGFRLRLLFNWAFADWIGIQIRPFYQFTEIGKSNGVNVESNGSPITRILEPDSRTHQVGMHAGIIFEF